MGRVWGSSFVRTATSSDSDRSIRCPSRGEERVEEAERPKDPDGPEPGPRSRSDRWVSVGLGGLKSVLVMNGHGTQWFPDKEPSNGRRRLGDGDAHGPVPQVRCAHLSIGIQSWMRDASEAN